MTGPNREFVYYLRAFTKNPSFSAATSSSRFGGPVFLSEYDRRTLERQTASRSVSNLSRLPKSRVDSSLRSSGQRCSSPVQLVSSGVHLGKTAREHNFLTKRQYCPKMKRVESCRLDRLRSKHFRSKHHYQSMRFRMRLRYLVTT